MNKRAGQRFWSMGTIIMLCLMLVLSACASNSGGKGNTTEQEQTNAVKETANTEQPATSSEPAKAEDEIVELDIFIDQYWWPVKDFEGSVSKEITKRTGVKLNVTIAADEKQLPLMIASGELPDLVATSDQWMRMSDPSLSHDWKSLIDEHAPHFEIDQERIAVNTMEDGNFYTIRNNFSTTEEWEKNKNYALLSGAGIAYRKDIAEEVGVTEINTLDDMLNLFDKVKQKYPEMIPLALNSFWKKHFFAWQFGAAWDHFDEQDGKIIHTLRTPELEKTYMFMNELYRRGFTNAENYALKNEDQTKALATSGKAFAYTWTTKVADALNAETEAQGMKWTNFPTKLSDEFRYIRMDTGWQGLFITKNNKNVAAAIKLAQFLMSEEGQRLSFYGIEGVDYNMSPDDGYPIYTFNYMSEEEKSKRGIAWGMLAGSAVHELISTYVPDSEEVVVRRQLMDNTEFNWAMGLIKSPPNDTEESVIATNIKTMIENEETKVYLAETEEEARQQFQKMVEQAEKMGMAKLEEWANKKYVESLKLFK
ncbi:extracellular solute-binding protein [Paenibacillus yanchengensis]|uniref:Extracellular solute-binding protein n=1 Tax=Paenibacillus yanchengensis TaxID=2035833 RepID=A0ABW4YID3_9BACL